MKEIEPLDLKRKLDGGQRVVLLDVRQPDEHELVRLEGSTLVPLMEVPERLDEIRDLLKTPHDCFVVYCRSGARSAQALGFLESQGIAGGFNLRGGVNSYAREADTSLTPY